LKEEFGAIRRNFTSGISFHGLLIFLKVKECFEENEKLGVLEISGPSKVLFFDFLHKDALWCILIMQLEIYFERGNKS
jgi:hypothetical protein